MAGQFTIRANNAMAAFIDGERTARKDDREDRQAAADLERTLMSNEITRALAPHELQKAMLSNQQIQASTSAILGQESRSADLYATQYNYRMAAAEEAGINLEYMQKNRSGLFRDKDLERRAINAQNQYAVAMYGQGMTSINRTEADYQRMLLEQKNAQAVVDAQIAAEANKGDAVAGAMGDGAGAVATPTTNVLTGMPDTQTPEAWSESKIRAQTTASKSVLPGHARGEEYTLQPPSQEATHSEHLLRQQANKREAAALANPNAPVIPSSYARSRFAGVPLSTEMAHLMENGITPMDIQSAVDSVKRIGSAEINTPNGTVKLFRNARDPYGAPLVEYE